MDEILHIMDRSMIPSFTFQDKEYLNGQSFSFLGHGRGPLRGRVGVLDGLAVKIREPSVNDFQNTSVYFNGKGFFAVNVQDMCD